MKMTAKKTRVIRNSVIFLLVCALASLILSAVLFKTNPDRTGASASVEFTFKGAADGLGPNGSPFNMSGIHTDEVIQKALETAGLSEKYTVEQIRDNLIVSGVYPENIIEQMTKYDSILNGNNNEQVKALDYHPTLYTVSLYNDFDTSIPEQQLKNLLSEILSGFRSWFNQVYSVSMTASEPLSDISAFDYTHQLTLIRESASQQQRFAQEMAQKEPAFRTEEACGQLEKGSGFDDAVALYTSLLDNDVSRAEAMVSLYALSKDREQLKAVIENRIRSLNNELKEQTEELSQLEKLVSDYVKDDILYVGISAVVAIIVGIVLNLLLFNRLTGTVVGVNDYLFEIVLFGIVCMAFTVASSLLLARQWDYQRYVYDRQAYKKKSIFDFIRKYWIEILLTGGIVYLNVANLMKVFRAVSEIDRYYDMTVLAGGPVTAVVVNIIAAAYTLFMTILIFIEIAGHYRDINSKEKKISKKK